MNAQGFSGAQWTLSTTAQEWLLNLVHEAIYVRDLDGRILFWNSGAEEMYGWSPQDAQGKIAYDLLQTQFPAPLEEITAAVFRDGRWESELTQAARDGSELVVLCRWVPLRNESGEPEAIIVINDDLTSQREIQKKLLESETRLQTLVDNAPVVLFAIDAEGILTLSEGQGLTAIGVASQELVGESIFDLYADNAEVIAATRGALAGERTTVDIRIDAVVYSATYSPTRGRGGEVTGVIGVAVDVTTRELVSTQLRSAKAAAEEANRAKSQFLANMSHEIRTPMNGVIGMTELLLETGLSAQQRDYAQTLQSSGEALLSVINDILDFSKIEAGKMELELTNFDLRETIEEITQLFAAPAHKKGLDLSGFVEPGTPQKLVGDYFRIRQILINIVGNAIKFTDSGEVVISASCNQETEAVATIQFEVTDTGIGVSKDQEDRLFSAFSQAEDSTSRRFGGTGLGLSIASRLSELMGGEMGMISIPGSGSTFTFTAPLMKHAPGDGDADPQEHPQNMLGRRVLVVDDSPTNRSILEHQLASWGIHSAAAEDGPRALQMLREAAEAQEHYDLAILDMHMPGMDGITLARVITADPTHEGTRLLLLTSIGESLGEQASQAGISAYLTKPVRQTQLLESLTQVMTARDAKGETAKSSSAKNAGWNQPLQEGSGERAPYAGRILLVEDNLINQQVASAMLRNLGYTVETAANGRLAVEAATRHSFDAVLMDIQMPELDGYAATAQMRRMETESGKDRLPVIALTANAMAEDRDQALAAGMDDHLPKPIHQKQLQLALSRWVGSPAGGVPDLTAAAERTSSPLDRGILEALRALDQPGGNEVFAELVGMFLEDAPAQIEKIGQAITQNDHTAAVQLAHALQGSSGSMGALHLSKLAGQVQELSRTRDYPQLSQRLRLLEIEFEAVKGSLEKELAKTV